MRIPANSKRLQEAGHVAGNGVTEAACSAAAVYSDIGLVLAVFLGLALAISATLTALGIN